MSISATPHGRHARRLPLFTWLGLALLLVVNLAPLLLVIRQAFTPESESVNWPFTLLPASFSVENLTGLWRTERLMPHVFLSLWVALGTTGLSLLLGFPAGWAAARLRSLGSLMTRASLVSRILPPIAIAIPLTALLNQFYLYDQPSGAGLIIAHLTIGLPFAILLSYATFRDMPPSLEEAAIVDGCSTFGAFLRIALPSSRGAIGGAFILIFLLSWDEFPYALLIQLTNRTMPPLVYYYTNYGKLGTASILAVLMLIPALAVIATLQGLLRRGMLKGGVNE